MQTKDVQDLTRKAVAILRLSLEEWDAVAGTRLRGTRFSLNFPHEDARSGQRGGLVLITTSGSQPTLRIGVIGSIGATATFDTRVVFDLVSIIRPRSLHELLGSITASELRSPRGRLAESELKFERITTKLGEALISAIAGDPANVPALVRVLAALRKPKRYDNARAMQRDAVRLAIKAFGGGEASAIALPGDDTAIATVRILEDAAIEHDARWMPGWRLADSDLTGRATFEKSGERLEVFTSNKRPLEELFGVDLIYLNQTRGALVMVQYKMLEGTSSTRDPDGALFVSDEETEPREWICRIDDQFTDELARMRIFDRDLAPDGPYRLSSGAFFFKFVRRRASADSAGIVLSLGHFDSLMSSGELVGPKSGLRLSYQSLEGQYLRGDGFVELIRSGYIGTRGATTEHLQALIEASLTEGKAVVAGIQTALAS